MKSSEAKPLSAEELQTLQQLFQRWVLLNFSSYRGSSEESDAFNLYQYVKDDAQRGFVRKPTFPPDKREYKESSLDD